MMMLMEGNFDCNYYFANYLMHLVQMQFSSHSIK
jgi:hypothetical protein